MRLAAAVGIEPRVMRIALEDADRALNDLAEGALTGAAVLDLTCGGLGRCRISPCPTR